MHGTLTAPSCQINHLHESPYHSDRAKAASRLSSSNPAIVAVLTPTVREVLTTSYPSSQEPASGHNSSSTLLMHRTSLLCRYCSLLERLDVSMTPRSLLSFSSRRFREIQRTAHHRPPKTSLAISTKFERRRPSLTRNTWESSAKGVVVSYFVDLKHFSRSNLVRPPGQSLVNRHLHWTRLDQTRRFWHEHPSATLPLSPSEPLLHLSERWYFLVPHVSSPAAARVCFAIFEISRYRHSRGRFFFRVLRVTACRWVKKRSSLVTRVDEAWTA